jgi:dihydrofolate reductase
MAIISLIVAHANHRIIGKDNTMPWHLPADLAYFKQVTMGKPVVMGRKTFESIGRALPGRHNVVITRDPNYSADHITVVNSLQNALDVLHNAEEIMVIGGGSIYQAALPLADKLYITKILADIAGDTQFPVYDETNDWQLVAEKKYSADEKNSYDLVFCEYQRKSSK